MWLLAIVWIDFYVVFLPSFWNGTFRIHNTNKRLENTTKCMRHTFGWIFKKMVYKATIWSKCTIFGWKTTCTIRTSRRTHVLVFQITRFDFSDDPMSDKSSPITKNIYILLYIVEFTWTISIGRQKETWAHRPSRPSMTKTMSETRPTESITAILWPRAHKTIHKTKKTTTGSKRTKHQTKVLALDKST